MTEKAHAIIILLRWLFVLAFFSAIFTVFVYSPYYAKSIIWLLNRYVNVQVDPIAAQSQQSGQLNSENNLEPGSPEWVARRAYLYEVNQSLKDGDAKSFSTLQQRYQLLLLTIEEQKQKQPEKEQESADVVDEQDSVQDIDFLARFDNQNEPLFQQYREFLKQDDNLIHMTEKNDEVDSVTSPYIMQRPAYQPHAIVILGGGLTSGKKKGEIIVNVYTQKRLQQAVEIYQKHPLPIVLSGVEAPYMQKWLEQHQIKAQFLENRSMNTCENTRFSSLLLQKQGGAPTVFLVTDAYHMPRSQRLFAINGIATIPIIAPLPNSLTIWQPDQQNLMHSRRATYEMLATLRDVWFGESNCREIP